MLRLTLLLAVSFLVAAASARADEGETYVDIAVSPELAWLSHPAVHDAAASPFDATGTFTFLPRLAGCVRYGLTNDLHVGLGFEGAAFGNLAAKGVSVENTTGDLFTGGYLELGAPLSFGWRFDSGYDFTGLLELQLGPMLTLWSGNALGDPTNLDPNGLPSKLPVDIADTWSPGASARLQAAFEARLFDIFVIAAAPYAGVSWAATPGVHAGIVIRPSLALGVGPL